MVHSPSYYKELLSRFIRDELSAEDISVLYAFIKEEPEAYEAIMNDPDIMTLAESQSEYFRESLSGETEQKLKQQIFSYIDHEIPGVQRYPRQPGLIRIWYWAAASIIVLLGLGIYFYTSFNKKELPIAVNTPIDIEAPATNRAMITLADGSRVFLDSVNNGQLAQLGNIKLVKLAGGQIAYQTADGQILKELQHNTLTNPRGSKVIDMQLSDGTRVWLNAGSSITYPVAFVGGDRKVELKGEGYFEVAKDPAKKFIVTANGTTTEVLGTHFNVNAYNDEGVTKVTLLEGLVKVAGGNGPQVMIKPGQQAKITGSQKPVISNFVDLDRVIAWKNGYFSFDDLTFDEIMSEIERWYDVNIVYNGEVPAVKIGGDINRSTSLEGTIQVLEYHGIKIKRQGKTLVIF